MGGPSGGAFEEPIPHNLLREPMEYLFADHMRQMAACLAVYELADTLNSHFPGEDISSDIRATIQKALHYLTDELALHIADEEMDILPRLRMRAHPEDDIPAIIKKVDTQHAKDENLAEELASSLHATLATPGARLPLRLIEIAGRFAESHCGHMKWENEVLLPLARMRLTKADQEQIGRTMARRRGIPYPD